jgi:hypothetical protein
MEVFLNFEEDVEETKIARGIEVDDDDKAA